MKFAVKEKGACLSKKGESSTMTIVVVILISILLFLVFVVGLKGKISAIIP